MQGELVTLKPLKHQFDGVCLRLVLLSLLARALNWARAVAIIRAVPLR